MSDAIPLPPRPHLEQYRKQAKDLLKAVKSNDVRAWVAHWIDSWSDRWLETHARLRGEPVGREKLRSLVERIEQQVREAKIEQLSGAQFFLARAHGFESWPKFAKHIEAPDANFEAAADAIIEGDIATVQRLLREDPSLIRRRSNREHRSALLHYTAANGVEDFRQKTPPNIVEIAKLLLDSGADPSAESDAYSGRSTTLGLAATSVHPQRAGVQLALLQLLLDRGARIDRDALKACLANGQPEAAAFLAARGAHLDLFGAAGIGRADVVRRLLDEGADPTEKYGGYPVRSYAAYYGHPEVARLIDAAVAARVRDVKRDAQVVRNEGDRDEAAKLYEQAVALCRDIDDPLLLAHTIRHLGDVHYEAGRRDAATPLLEEALAIYRAHDTPQLELANAIRSLAIAREDAGALDDAATLWEEAHQLYTATNVEPGIAETARRLRRIRGA